MRYKTIVKNAALHASPKVPASSTIQAENKPNARHIETFQRFETVEILVLLQNSIVQLADRLAGQKAVFYSTLIFLYFARQATFIFRS